MATYQLRPMSVGEILDGALAIYRDHFATLVAIVIACQGVPAVMNVYATLGGGVEAHPVLIVVAALLSGVGGLLAAGATIWVISEAYLGGDPNVGDALAFALGKAVRILIAGLAKYLVIGLAVIVPMTLALVGIAVAVRSAIALLYVAAVVAGGIALALMLAAGYSVVTQAVVLEPLPGATDALGRSWRLTRGSRWRAILLGLVVLVLIALPYGVAIGVALAFPMLEASLDVGAQLISLMVYPIGGCAFTLFYYDLRVRREAFDLEHLSSQLGAPPETRPA